MKCEYILRNGDSWRKMLKYDFFRGRYLPSNEAIANVVLYDLDLNFQGQIVQVYILASKRWKNANITIANR